jgi:metal-responsive CopG/Arc/MetJ family transcriptional regulator
METIQVVLDQTLLRATDQAARRNKQNRSQLIRDALRSHLRRLQVRALEETERAAYSRQPASVQESLLWEREAAWPAE